VGFDCALELANLERTAEAWEVIREISLEHLRMDLVALPNGGGLFENLRAAHLRECYRTVPFDEAGRHRAPTRGGISRCSRSSRRPAFAREHLRALRRGRAVALAEADQIELGALCAWAMDAK